MFRILLIMNTQKLPAAVIGSSFSIIWRLRLYRKYQEQTIAPVEEAYLETIQAAEEAAKAGERKNLFREPDRGNR